MFDSEGHSDIVVHKAQLHRPPLEEVARILEHGLKENFTDVQVSVVDCPDLSQKPYMLAAPGLGGSPRIADVGGVPHLIPIPQKNKKYDLERVSKLAEVPGGLVIGAGAGPCHVEGVNCEMMANISTSREGKNTYNNTHISKVDLKDGSCILKKPNSSEFCLLGNFFISEGKPGKVLEVKASHRKGDLNYMSCLRETLEKHYGTKPVGLGGTFLIGKGKANIHIMPDFSKTPLNSDEEIDKWLNFYEMSAPLVCVGELISYDPGLDLRMEHFHCFSDHGEGGHYHYDTTPAEVQYHGYFNIAEFMIRIDPPKETHNIGRD